MGEIPVFFSLLNQWIVLVLVIGARDSVTTLEGNIYLVYKRYILPIG